MWHQHWLPLSSTVDLEMLAENFLGIISMLILAIDTVWQFTENIIVNEIHVHIIGTSLPVMLHLYHWEKC